MGANKGFNGTTLSWNSVSLTNEMLSVTVSQKKAKVKLPPDSAGQPWTYVQGAPDLEISVEVAGGASLTDDGLAHQLTLAWNDGTSLGTYTNARLFDTDVKGSLDNPISTTFKFAPGPAGAS
jgi:hypothetical protein